MSAVVSSGLQRLQNIKHSIKLIKYEIQIELNALNSLLPLINSKNIQYTLLYLFYLNAKYISFGFINDFSLSFSFSLTFPESRKLHRI